QSLGCQGVTWALSRAFRTLIFIEYIRSAKASTPILAGMHAPPDLDQSLASFTSRTGGLVVVVSDLLSPSWDKALGRLASRPGEVVVLHTLSPQELHPTLGGDVRLIDRESGAAVSVTLNNDAIRLYGQRLDEWRRNVESFCARHGMCYVPIDTAQTVETVVFDVLRRLGVVRCTCSCRP